MSYTLQFADGLMVLTFTAELTPEACRRVVEDIAVLEKSLERTPNRLVDISLIQRFGVGYPDFESMANARRALPPKNPIRSAVVAPHDLQFGIGRMFETLNQHPLVTTAVFRNRETALAWLKESPTAG